LTTIRDHSPDQHSASKKKRVPPESTNAEQYYYLKQMSNRTPIVIRLTDDEEIRGIIEWYDKDCIKVNREDYPNILLPKHSIKYIYKEAEG
jgi:sRNA-binding regulator protein Hfq